MGLWQRGRTFRIVFPARAAGEHEAVPCIWMRWRNYSHRAARRGSGGRRGAVCKRKNQRLCGLHQQSQIAHALETAAGTGVVTEAIKNRSPGGRMALLIIELDKYIGDAKAWRDTFKEQIPDLPIRIWPDTGELREIEYLAFMHPDFDLLPAFPNLKAMFSRAAGVDSFVKHPKLPKVPLGKVEPPGGDPMMTEYVIMHVLRFHRDMPAYQAAQANREWRRAPIIRPEQRRVGFLGFGMMAKTPALMLKSLGFKVSAWVRSPRQAAEVPIFHGRDQLEPFLNQTDIAVCLLPLTGQTEGIFCTRTFAMMPRGAMLVNVGRGKHVVDQDLIAALDSGQLSYAALDALWPEPLPPESPLWLHPKVTVMPHVARRPTVAQLVTEMVANIRSLEAGGPLLEEVDLTLGY
jgi:glyoxylate/hydroxypyruvate reductase